MSTPLVILAEGHFGGTLALVAAIVCTALPFIYGITLWVAARRRGRDPKMGLVCAAVLAIGFGVGLVPYWLRASLGSNTSGVVTSSEIMSRSSQGTATVFTITLDDGRTLEETVDNEDHAKMTVGERVAVREVSAIDGFERLGDEATLSQGTLFGSLILWGLLAVATVALSRSADEERDHARDP